MDQTYHDSRSLTTATSSYDRPYITDYRSSRSHNHIKTSVYRSRVVVHNEYARGYDPKEPSPAYGVQQCSGSDERRRRRRAHEDDHKIAYASCTDRVIEEVEFPLNFDPFFAKLRPDLFPTRNTSWQDGPAKQLVHQHSPPAPFPRSESFHGTRPEIKKVHEDEISTSTSTTSPSASIDDSESEKSSSTNSSIPEIDLAVDVAQISRPFTADRHKEEEVDIYDWASQSSFISEERSESVFTYASSIPGIYHPLPNPIVGSVGSGGRLLPCEFSRYGLCSEWFYAQDTNAWAEHVITDHLRNKIPSKCCCWFCDDYKFIVAQTGVDRYNNFMCRMEHIREHLVGDGYTIDRSRPDFDFLDHLWNEKLISRITFDAVREWQDGPPSRVKGLYTYNFEPAESLRMREQSNWIPVDQKREDRERMHSRSSHQKMPQSRASRGRVHCGRSPNSSRATNARSASPSNRNRGSGHRQVNSDQTTPSRSDRLREHCESRRGLPEPSISLHDLDTNMEPQNSQQELERKLGMLVISETHIVEEKSKAQEADNAAKVRIDVGKPQSTSPQSPRAAQRVRKKRSVVLFDERIPVELSQQIHLAAHKLVESLPLEILTQACGVREHTNTSKGQSNSNGSFPRDVKESSQPGPSSRQYVRPQKRKRKSRDDSNDRDSDGEQKRLRSPEDKKKEVQLLACPFYKRNGLRYGHRLYCNASSGWPDMHRLKQHLSRRHREKHCPRCFITFKEDERLNAHQRAQPPCDVLDEFLIDGLTAEKEKQISPRAAFSGMKECDKWRKVYMILFPGVTEDQIPSCYSESQEFQDTLADARFQAHLRRGLTPHLVNALMKQVREMRRDVDSEQAEECCKKAVGAALEGWLQDAHAPMLNQTATSSHLGDGLGTTTIDSPRMSIEQTESSTPRSISEVGATDLASDTFLPLSDWSYEQLLEGPGFAFLTQSLEVWDPSDLDTYLDSSDGIQQYTGVEKPTSDSGYGSRPDQTIYPGPLPR